MAPSQQQDSFIDDSDEFCPLCVEEFDLSDKNFKPCPCGYQICQFCFNNIRKNLNGLCPACRREYSDETIEFKTVSQAEFRADLQKQSKKKAELKQKEQQKRELEAINRKHLSGLRVVQKNLVYVTGLNPGIREENLLQTLRGQDYFGQYGRIIKIVVNKRTGEKSGSHTIDLSGKSSGGGGGGGGIGVYVTFQRKEDAASCITAVDGSVNGDRVLRATYGTTKYCSAYLRNEQCSNKNCMFLHEPGEDADSFTRQDLSSFNVKSNSQRGASSNTGPPPQHPPVAAAVQPTISRQASGYQGGAGIKPPRTPATVENSPAMGSSALPATVNWATKGPGTPVGGKPASLAAQSPRSVSEKTTKTVHERENNAKAPNNNNNNNNSASSADHSSKGPTNGNKQAVTTSPPPIQTKQPKKSQIQAPPPPAELEKKPETSPKQPSPAAAPASVSTPAPAPAPTPAPAPAPAASSADTPVPADSQPSKEPAKNPTPASTPAPADPTTQSANDLTERLVECLKCITSPKFRFVFDKSMLSEEEFKEIQNMPPLFDKFGGAKRRERLAKEREREIEEEKLRLQQQAQAQQQAQQQANQPPQSAPLPAQQPQLQSAQQQQQPPQPPASAHSLQRQLPQQMSSFLMHQQAQPQQHQAGRAQTPGSAIPPGQFNIFGGSQQQAQQTMQTQMPQQSQHTRQHSRYNFANEGPNSGLKPTAASNQQQQHLNQQQQLLPQHNQQQSLLQAQLYGFGSGNSSVQAPPPGLKSAPTPPTMMNMYGQQGGFGLNLANAGQQQPGASHLGHSKSDSQDLLHLMRTGNVKQLGDPSILQARLGPQQHPMQHQLNGLIGQGQQGGFASVYYGSSNRW